MGNTTTAKKGTKSPEVIGKFTDEIDNQLGGFVPDFFKQFSGYYPDSRGASSDSYQKSPDAPLTLKDPHTGKVEVFNAASHKKVDGKAEKAPKAKEAAIHYGTDVAKSSERAMHTEMREVNERLKEIMVELQRLISSSKELKMEFADVDVQQAPQQAGEYHINFFDWLLLTIRAARQKVEDSGAWLNTVKGKKGKKGYWGMFKKHGTSFGLSNERSVATQTG